MAAQPEPVASTVEAPTLEFPEQPTDVVTVESAHFGTPEFDEAFEVETRLFHAVGYVESPEHHRESYEAYQASSRFFIVRVDGEIAGVLRAIEHSEAGFKTAKDFPLDEGALDGVDPSKILEIGTVAVEPKFHQQGIRYAERLYHAAVVESLNPNVLRDENQVPVSEGPQTHWIASIDEGLLRKVYNPYYHFRFWDIGPTIFYLGSKTTPVMMDCAKTMQEMKEFDEENGVYTRVILGNFSD